MKASIGNVVQWFITIAVLALLAYQFFPLRRPVGPDDLIAQSNFAAQYARSRELLDLFSNCRQGSDLLAEQRIEVNEAFADLRKVLLGSGFENQSLIIDRQMQVFEFSDRGVEIKPFSPCARLAYLAPVTRDQVLASIAATKRLVVH